MTTNFPIAILGAPGVGKTSAYIMWTNGVVLEKYECTVSEGPRKVLQIGKTQYVCDIADVGETEFAAMTEIIYTKATGFLILYSTTDLESFTIAEEKLKSVNEVRQKAIDEGKNVPQARFVLWGTKSDLVDERKVTAQQGEELAKQFGIPFMEGSARIKHQTEEVCMSLVQQLIDLNNPPAKRKRCIVM